MSLEHTDIPYLNQLDETTWTAGQPSPEQLDAAKAAGLQSIVNLCPTGECGWDEQAKVEALGLPYVQIPVAAASDLSPDNAAILAQAISELPKPVLVHCASSNRVGALFALKAHLIDEAAPADALDYGRKAGLKGLEGVICSMIGA